MFTCKEWWGSVIVLCPYEAEKRNLATWSLKPLKASDDVYAEKGLVTALSEVLESLNIRKVYAPCVTNANARIIRANEYGWIPIGYIGRPTILRNPTCHADGVVLNLADGACMMSMAGCPIIVATGGNEVIVAHAGRDSLIGRASVDEQEGYLRTHQSVVESIVATFWNMGIPPGKITVHAFFAIPSGMFVHEFEHPTHGHYNQRLYELIRLRWANAITEENEKSFCLSLNNLIVAQAHDVGVESVVVSDSITDHPELAHTRDWQNKDRRNLVIVRR